MFTQSSGAIARRPFTIHQFVLARVPLPVATLSVVVRVERAVADRVDARHQRPPSPETAHRVLVREYVGDSFRIR